MIVFGFSALKRIVHKFLQCVGEWTQHHPHLIPICKSEKNRTLLSCRTCKLFDELITETLMLRFIWAHSSAQAGQKTIVS